MPIMRKPMPPMPAETTIKQSQWRDKSKYTYGERITLGRIFSTNKTTAQKCRESIKALHSDMDRVDINETNLDYTAHIYEGVKWWIEQEKTRLAYTPTAEEKAAGVSNIADMGSRGTAAAMGKDFGVAPSEVYNWLYGDVFAVLELDIRRAKFNRRIAENRERKRKSNTRRRR